MRPATSYYDASFNWRVKWQDDRLSWANKINSTDTDIPFIGMMKHSYLKSSDKTPST